MKVKKTYQTKGAFELIEEAVHLLRGSPLKLLAPYHIGSLPFVLGLLFFWSDMSQNAFAAERCVAAALGMAILFLWMKCWQSVFMSRVRIHMIDMQEGPWSWSRVLRMIVVQGIIQPSGLVVLPIATMIMFPFAWCYAFYQTISMEGNGFSSETGRIIWESWALSKLWSGQNHIMLMIISLFSLFVFLNVRIALVLIPQFLKTFFDLESSFTTSGPHLLNSTLFFISGGITYLCVDPLVKTVYALRCFYGKAMASGDDIKSDLARFRLQKKAGMLLTLFFAIILFPISGHYFAETNSANKNKPGIIQAQELDRCIQEVMEQRQFTWRMPREKPQNEPQGFLGKIVERVNAFLKKTLKSIMRAIDRFFRLLRKLFPETSSETKTKDFSWIGSIRVILYLIVALLIALGLVLGYKLWKKQKKEKAETLAEKTVLPPDLNEADINPLDFTPPYWLTLSDQLMKNGSLRLALRAVYLGMVAYLAEKGLIGAAKYKSNRDYLNELKRREHALQGLVAVFGEDVRSFDRIWYGMKEVCLEDVDRFRSDYERIMNLAQA